MKLYTGCQLSSHRTKTVHSCKRSLFYQSTTWLFFFNSVTGWNVFFLYVVVLCLHLATSWSTVCDHQFPFFTLSTGGYQLIYFHSVAQWIHVMTHCTDGQKNTRCHKNVTFPSHIVHEATQHNFSLQSLDGGLKSGSNLDHFTAPKGVWRSYLADFIVDDLHLQT